MKSKYFVLAVVALAFVFSACDKEATNNAGGGGLKSAVNFDPSARWYVSWDWVQHGGFVSLYTEFYGDGTNPLVWDGVKAGTGTAADGQNNEVQKIYVRSSLDGDLPEYNAFCAHVGSWAYSGNAYKPAGLRLDAYLKILGAFNYIWDTYGSLDGWCEGPEYKAVFEVEDATKVLAQMAVWYFIPEDADRFKVLEIRAKDDRYAAVNDAFAAVIKAGENFYNGTGMVRDLAYLCDELNGGIGANQPQIVPIYGPPNRKLGPVLNTVTATNAGNQASILAGLNPKNGNPYYGDKKEPNTPFVVPNSSHFVYSEFTRTDLEKGVALDMMNGNKFTIVGKGFVKLVDGSLVITMNGVGTFGAIAFNQLPVTNNGNIQSQKVADLAKFGALTGFNHDNKTVIPCPGGDTIFLYIHCATMQFYQ
jgi:hypothetical protein